MRRETQHVLLLLLGGALLRIAADDTYLRYVRPAHRPLLLAAGTVMVALAVLGAVRDLRGHSIGDGHAHGNAERFSPWLLLAPVLVIAVAAPPALGADAVLRSGQANVVGRAVAAPPLPAGAVVDLTVGEFVQRALFDAPDSLAGRQVRLTGFAVRRNAGTELARLTITCCAADALVHRVRLAGDVGDPEPDTWLRVQGEFVAGSGSPAGLPTIAVTRWETVAAPADPYEY